MAGDLASELNGVVADLHARVSYGFRDLSSGATVVRDEGSDYPTASTIKLPILTTVCQFVESSDVRWSDRVEARPEDAPGGSGVLEHLSLPLKISYEDAAWLMICVSDNLATNLLLRLVGLEKVNALLQELVGRGLYVRNYAGYSGIGYSESMGRGTIEAFLTYLRLLYEGKIPGSVKTRAIAEGQMFNSLLSRHIPYSSYGSSGVALAHKTGSLPGVRADVGLMSKSDRAVAMAVFVDAGADRGAGFDRAAEELMGQLGAIVYERWMMD